MRAQNDCGMVQVTWGCYLAGLAGRLGEELARIMAGQTDCGASALIVAEPGSWRDALLAMLDEIPRIATIHLARDAGSALRSAAASCSDLVLLDADLPGGSAASFLRELEAVCPHTRSLVLTSEPPNHSGTLLPDAVLIKGCSAAVLFQVLESLMPDSGGDSQTTNARPSISRR